MRSYRPTLPPVIAHVDMNTFFVSVERLKDPTLEGKPVVVGGDPLGRSVVSSASYEARTFGIHSAMAMTEARRRCPELIIVRGSFRAYDHYHHIIKKILHDFSPSVLMTSIDEGYLILTGTEKLWGKPLAAGNRIRDRILGETALPLSVGIGANKLIAKVAAEVGKPTGDPRLGELTSRQTITVTGSNRGAAGNGSATQTADGVVYVLPGREAEFLAPLPLEQLPGCGRVTARRLREIGLRTIGDIAGVPAAHLERAFGESGKSLWKRANGTGSSHLELEQQRKSISKETTFRQDVTDTIYLRSTLHRLMEDVGAILRQRDLVSQTITVKLRYENFETHTFTRSLLSAGNLNEELFSHAANLFEEHYDKKRAVRLIGIALSNLGEGSPQEDLFASLEERGREEQRTAALDQIRQRFGKESILSGESVKLIGGTEYKPDSRR